MENVIPVKIQIISIVVSISFLIYVSRLIIKGKLDEEYAIVWIAINFFLILFSFWRNGLEIIAKFFGVYAAPNLIFTATIFVIFCYLVHLSIVTSKFKKQNKTLIQEIALLKNEVLKLKENQ